MPSRSRDGHVAHLRKTGARKRKDSLGSGCRAGARRVVWYALHWEATLREHSRVAARPWPTHREPPGERSRRVDHDRESAKVVAKSCRLSTLPKEGDRLAGLKKAPRQSRCVGVTVKIAGGIRTVRVVAVIVAPAREAQDIPSDRLAFGAQVVRQRLRSQLRSPVFNEQSDRRHVPVAAALDPLEVERSPRCQRYHRASRVEVSIVVAAV